MRLSASAIRRFKRCPLLFYYEHILGLRPAVEADHFRMGTNWHRIQEISSMVPGGACECTYDTSCFNLTHLCELCDGTGRFPDDPMDAVIRHLNKVYADVPLDKTADEWEVERTILLYSLVGYQWWYSEAGYEVERLEHKFDMPLLSPETGHPLRASVVGKIDRVFSIEGRRYIHEYKSTSASLDPDSDYWGSLQLDTQTRLYAYASEREGLGKCGLLYDVWRKPQIRPKKLTQAESKKFVTDGEYCGEEFTVVPLNLMTGDISVNGRAAEVLPGAKEGTFAIRETPEMFGARLLQEITNDPGKYFARREVERSESDIKAFEQQLYSIYKTISYMKKTDNWIQNEGSCESRGKCDFLSQCYSQHRIAEDEIPMGFTKYVRN